MAYRPPPPSFSAVWRWLLTLLVALPAERDADSIQSDRRDLRDPTLILDSGASCHATSDKSLLSNLTAAAPEDLPVAEVGTVASEKFQLPGVLHAPSLAPGTVRVSVQLLAAWGYLVLFGGGGCLVMERSGGKLVGQGRLQEDDGLYRLEFLKIPLDAAPADAAIRRTV